MQLTKAPTSRRSHALSPDQREGVLWFPLSDKGVHDLVPSDSPPRLLQAAGDLPGAALSVHWMVSVSIGLVLSGLMVLALGGAGGRTGRADSFQPAVDHSVAALV